jgi:putative YjhG/YagF family dehydratase
VVCEALGFSLTHSALSPSGQSIWTDMARRSARALFELEQAGITTADILTDASIYNAMAVHAAFGGSTNLLMHVPAIAHAARLPRPAVEDWARLNRQVPRLVDVIPNGPVGYGTVQVFLAGGVPEVMLHLRGLDLLRLEAFTVQGHTLGEALEAWEASERRKRLKERLRQVDGVDPDDVILDPESARQKGLTSTVCFLTGNLAPQGAVVKSTALDPSVVDNDGVYRKTGPARVFTREHDAIMAIKGEAAEPVRPGDVMVLVGRGPLGAGMEEVYEVTAALRHLPWGKEVALITDARFSGVSTGACIGHASPEGLAGGPIGRVRDGDTLQVIIDRINLAGRIDLVGNEGQVWGPEQGSIILASRSPHPDLSPDPDLPDDVRLWAALQNASGGVWGGCVYDVDKIIELLDAAKSV